MSLKPAQIENYSGVILNWRGKISPLRKGNFFVVENISVGGDAPKDFIRVYEYGVGKKQNPASWNAFIAKVGHKWYPIESITEYFFNRIGEVLGFHMASSRLMVAGEQIRFLSRFFLKQGEQLVHGAQIFAGYINDMELVEIIEKEKLAREFFTYQFVYESLNHQFKSCADDLMSNFSKLLFFDALIGNNDRHFYNWGVITDINGISKPRFSPIYDTARGLFWNTTEAQVKMLTLDEKRRNDYLGKYIRNSLPKTGWQGRNSLNHFELIRLITKNYAWFSDFCLETLNSENFDRVSELLETEFQELFSRERRFLIRECLKLRFDSLRESITQGA